MKTIKRTLINVSETLWIFLFAILAVVVTFTAWQNQGAIGLLIGFCFTTLFCLPFLGLILVLYSMNESLDTLRQRAKKS